MELVVSLEGEVGCEEVDQLPAAGDLVGGRTVGVVILVAAVLFGDAPAVVAVQLAITRGLA